MRDLIECRHEFWLSPCQHLRTGTRPAAGRPAPGRLRAQFPGYLPRGSLTCADWLELQNLCGHLRSDDVLLVWRFNGMDRNLKDLLGFVNALEGRGI